MVRDYMKCCTDAQTLYFLVQVHVLQNICTPQNIGFSLETYISFSFQAISKPNP